ncbi:MAG TPA: isoprenylcysteine carboxylmethyltransferase family protein [Candidatus Angelobacter sp.]|nr:isoprenylcysteine carboxylmethyltransferase family protein [Candidatus Angelobacter sp.]
MRTLLTVWPYALVFSAVFIWAYAPEFILNRRSRKLPSSQDGGSLRLATLVQIPATAAAFVVALAGKFGALERQRLWFWVGVGSMVVGGLLRRHCFRMLGPSFTAVVVVAPGQQVVERGAYRWVRHPSYTAAAVFYAGLTLALGNWISVAILLSAAVLTYAYRVRVEERALLEALGEPYRSYMGRTKRFIPMVF